MILNSQKLNKLKKQLQENSLDFYLIVNKENMFYLLEREIEGYILIPRRGDDCFLCSDSRYQLELEKSRNKHLKICIGERNYLEDLVKILSEFGNKKNLGVESDIPLRIYQVLRRKIQKIKISSLDVVEEIRIIKDSLEIERIKKAVAITKNVIRKIVPYLCSHTEAQIQALLEFEFKNRGAEGIAFSPIIAAGKNSSFPHYNPGKHLLRKKDRFVLIDCGARIQGYCADLTRMVFWDRIPRVIKKAYRVVEEAQKLAISLVRDGISIRSLVSEVEGFIYKQGFLKNIFHGLGHGVGINVHERPVLSRYSQEVLKSGMVITIEPGLYFPGLGGVRKEDVILVDKDRGIKL